MIQFDLSRPMQLLAAVGPELVLMTGAMILLLYAVWGGESARRQRAVGIGSMVLVLITGAVVVLYMVRGGNVTLGPIAMDPFRWGADIVILLATLAAIALSVEYNEREGMDAGESHVLILFASSGMMMLTAARDLTIVFLGIEIMSVAVYVLAGLNRRSPRSAEAALKYFLLGSFATAFLLYGMALLYGATGTTNLQLMASRLAEAGAGNPMLLIGIAMLLIGFGFKVAIVPFHMWAPDVYEGAPTPVSAYMAAAVKAAGFVAFMRVWAEAMPGTTAWHFALWWLAVITMLAGNLIALAQRSVKRLLAYSSIAHGGYLLVALVAGGALGSSALVFYLFAYTLATIGAFAVVGALSGAGDRFESIDDFAGLWTERPWMAVAMAVFMLALLGFPVFGGAGFFAKWYIIQAALQSPSPQTRLAVVLVLTSVISAGYYLYVVMVMFMRPRTADRPAAVPALPATRLVIAAAAVLILAVGIYPAPVARLARTTAPQPAILQPTDTALVTAPASTDAEAALVRTASPATR